MRKDSCRVCGFELEPVKICLCCNQPNQFYCLECHRKTDEQIHFGCEKLYSVAILSGIGKTN